MAKVKITYDTPRDGDRTWKSAQVEMSEGNALLVEKLAIRLALLDEADR